MILACANLLLLGALTTPGRRSLQEEEAFSSELSVARILGHPVEVRGRRGLLRSGCVCQVPKKFIKLSHHLLLLLHVVSTFLYIRSSELTN